MDNSNYDNVNVQYDFTFYVHLRLKENYDLTIQIILITLLSPKNKYTKRQNVDALGPNSSKFVG